MNDLANALAIRPLDLNLEGGALSEGSVEVSVGVCRRISEGEVALFAELRGAPITGAGLRQRQREQWQQRVAVYRQERQRIEATRGLDDVERRSSIERLEAEQFDEGERLRLVAAFQQQEVAER